MWNEKWRLDNLTRRIVTLVVKAAESAAVQTNPYERVHPVVIVDLQLPLYSLTLQHLPQAPISLSYLQFAPALHTIADTILAKMAAAGIEAFNGLHLRVEKDMTRGHQKAGGLDAFLEGTYDLCSSAGLNQARPLYVATGLLSYDDVELWNQVKGRLLKEHASMILHKELYVDKPTLQALESEQLAAVDFLVLAKCKKFVGFAVSTFSLLLREYRQVNMIQPRESNWLLQATKLKDLSHIASDWCQAACFE
jgi:hypothetical protein